MVSKSTSTAPTGIESRPQLPQALLRHAVAAAALRTSALRGSELYGLASRSMDTGATAPTPTWRRAPITVVSATPLVEALTPAELEGAVACMRDAADADVQPGGIGWVHAFRSPFRALRIGRGGKGAGAPRVTRERTDDNFARLFRRGGALARDVGSNLGGAGVKVVGPTLEVALRVGDANVITLGGTLKVELGHGIPETDAVAAVGRMLEEVVGHDFFKGRRYRIKGVATSRLSTVISARTGLVPFSIKCPLGELGDAFPVAGAEPKGLSRRGRDDGA